MDARIVAYNAAQQKDEQLICDALCALINKHLKKSEAKLWHAHPVWFQEGNPIVGYSKLKAGIRLMFWSGRDFDEIQLLPGAGKFKDASVTYTDISQIAEKDIKRWLKKATLIQWDYKNIVKRKGKLVRLT